MFYHAIDILGLEATVHPISKWEVKYESICKCAYDVFSWFCFGHSWNYTTTSCASSSMEMRVYNRQMIIGFSLAPSCQVLRRACTRRRYWVCEDQSRSTLEATVSTELLAYDSNCAWFCLGYFREGQFCEPCNFVGIFPGSVRLRVPT